MGVRIRFFHYAILVAAVVCVCCSAKSSRLYIQPTDHSVSCPQNDCCTLNEWIESDLRLFTNEITIVLLSGVHVINTTQPGLLTEDTDSIIFTGVNGKNTFSFISSYSLLQDLD